MLPPKPPVDVLGRSFPIVVTSCTCPGNDLCSEEPAPGAQVADKDDCWWWPGREYKCEWAGREECGWPLKKERGWLVREDCGWPLKKECGWLGREECGLPGGRLAEERLLWGGGGNHRAAAAAERGVLAKNAALSAPVTRALEGIGVSPPPGIFSRAPLDVAVMPASVVSMCVLVGLVGVICLRS